MTPVVQKVCVLKCYARHDCLCSVAEGNLDPERAAELARVAGVPQGPSRKLKADENDIFNSTLIFVYPTITI